MSHAIRRMEDTDIESVYFIEVNGHIAPWSKEILRDCVLVGYDCRVLEVCENESAQIVGYIITRIAENTAHILNLCVAETKRSKGYGRELLLSLLKFLSKLHQIDNVVLEVRPSNKLALKLYNSLDFHPVDVKKDYYKDGSKIEDAILLKKILSF